MNFNILERATSIHQNYLLEASAGCGKTFSIENLFVRLLLEEHSSLKVDQILVVTFTKAGVADLKARICQNLLKAIHALKGEEKTYDYLQKIREEGDSAVKEALKILEEAYFHFDSARIYTIHSFAAKTLKRHAFEGDLPMQNEETKLLSSREMLRIVNSFLKVGVDKHFFSFTQMQRLLKKGDLKQKLFKEALKRSSYLPGRSSLDLFADFKKAMQALQRLNYTSGKVFEDFQTLYPCHKEMKNLDVEKAARFSRLFDQAEWTFSDFDTLLADTLIWVDKLSSDNRKVKFKNTALSLHYPASWEHFKTHLEPIVEEALSLSALLKRLTASFKGFLDRYKGPDVRYIYDDFITDLHSRLKNASFLETVRSQYKAAIIDEFQDTDQLQWEIFSKIFLEGDLRLYLVGDPKQSIYAFRDADIYTYYQAAKALGPGSLATLSKNFRATSDLVSCLNALFETPFLPLPRFKSSVACPPVESSAHILPYPFNDDLGPMHFVLPEEGWTGSLEEMEETLFFPFILQEIAKLSTPNQMACLVDDHRQSERLSRYLLTKGIPVVLQTGKKFADSSMLEPLQSILRAVNHPLKDSNLKRALGSELIGWTDQECLLLDQLELREKIVHQFFELQSHLNKGLEYFYPQLLRSGLRRDSLTMREGLLQLIGGKEKLNELDQFIEKLIEHEAETGHSNEKLLEYLTDIQENEEDLKFRPDTSQDGVSILTMHVAKGLEFDVVFPVGLINRRKFREEEINTLSIEESDAEKMRLLYVALTRAKQRVYIPIPSYPKPPTDGSFSLMELFFKGGEVLPKIQELQKLAPITFSRGLMAAENSLMRSPSLELLPPRPFQVVKQEKWVHSYTSLARKAAFEFKGAPADFESEEKTPFTLPSNKETGLLLHLLLEKISFMDIQRPSDLLPRIQPYLAFTRYAEWEEVLASILFNAVNHPLLEGFCLSQLDLNECYREIEFVYPHSSGYVKGVIDLVFKHAGKYYIVDWKSNWLGNRPEDYSPDKIALTMEEEDYYLQAKIYLDAVRLNLKGTGEIGGVLYYFLRANQPFWVPYE